MEAALLGAEEEPPVELFVAEAFAAVVVPPTEGLPVVPVEVLPAVVPVFTVAAEDMRGSAFDELVRDNPEVAAVFFAVAEAPLTGVRGVIDPPVEVEVRPVPAVAALAAGLTADDAVLDVVPDAGGFVVDLGATVLGVALDIIVTQTI